MDCESRWRARRPLDHHHGPIRKNRGGQQLKFFNVPSRPLFLFLWSFQQTINSKKMLIKIAGFEPGSSGNQSDRRAVKLYHNHDAYDESFLAVNLASV